MTRDIMGPPRDNPESNPLAVLLLDNQLYMITEIQTIEGG